MLEREDVAHLTKLWQTAPTPEISGEAIGFIKQFTRNDSLVIYCAGLSALAFYTGNDHYRQLSTALFDLALEKGLPIERLMPWHVPVDGLRNHVYNIETASHLTPVVRQRGLKTGFLHGHYRMLTPANWANALIARENCDLLILGLEDGWRTREYKGSEPVTRDWQRHQWVLASGFDGYLIRISRTPYTDKGYEDILKKIKPEIYFGNFSIPQEMQQEMIRRASVCGATYMPLARQYGFSTSGFLSGS